MLETNNALILVKFIHQEFRTGIIPLNPLPYLLNHQIRLDQKNLKHVRDSADKFHDKSER